MAVNFLIVESLLRYFMFYGKSLQVECPTGSGTYMNLGQCAEEIQHRLQHLFSRGEDGRRAINAGNDTLDFDVHWKDHLWFHEFFDGDTGRGLGASHQCGWTGLICKIIHDTGVNCRLPQTPKTPGAAAAHYADSYFDEPFVQPRHVRMVQRSTTSRSIGNRGGLTPKPNVVNGSQHGKSANDEANQHVVDYVEQQLERVRSNEPTSVYEDEFEAEVENGNGLQNGEHKGNGLTNGTTNGHTNGHTNGA